MGVRTEGDGHSNNWKLLIGLSVLCGVLVSLGGFLHRRALDAAIADRQAKPDAVRLPIVGLGIVLLVAGLLLMLQATKGRAPAKAPAKPSGKPGERKSGPSSSKGRVTGFDPVPVTVGRALDAPAEQVTDQPEPVAPAAVPEEPAPAAEPAVPGRTLFGMRLGSKKDKNENTAAGDAAREEAAAPSAGEPAAAKPKRSLFSRTEASVDTSEPAQPQDDKTATALEREIAIRQALED